ncbi:uncharacterized protein SPAPADRAFT_48363 [Spathaspora passalidarum NRRL Y-27907]|uniref:F-box domain-containing protein n=1 Tax=Spathaspora passalidarum (strain NRRL Y-27907 / 11-Y1) TaxID=619300 RepID=G3AGM4_SPAPN|nr:uncharacterized protein SPAPADRAFT_48363 [Spathaspora passalidarum NRRL Y-27907]EGW35363.1 hypothetical protein SPAPADRAFT_48363 [Spathaspora passalidarum NRRL Y-27907]
MVLELQQHQYQSKSRKSPALLDLPDEVLELIINQLTQLDIVQVRLLNSKLCDLASRKLYKNIYLNNSGPRIYLSNKLHTSFYDNYTIVNDKKKFKKVIPNRNMKYTQQIMFRIEHEDEIYLKMYIVELFPHIVIKGDPFDEEYFIYSDGISHFHLPSFRKPPQDRSLVNRLTIDSPLSEEVDIISQFSNIAKVELSEIDNFTLNLLSNFSHNFCKVTSLTISDRLELDIKLLARLFKLDQITSFQLQLYRNLGDGSIYSDFKWILSQMTNLKHLVLSSNLGLENYLSGQLNPNSLLSFVLISNYGPRYEFTLPMFLLEQQSITRLCFSTSTLETSIFWNPNRFERISRTNGEQNRGDKGATNYIQNLIRFGKCPRLNQFIINNTYYFVERHSNDSIDFTKFPE